MFFLISYGLLNYATYYEARSESPSFRPRFRWYHKNVSLIGGVACLGAMMTIDVTAGTISTVVLFAIYQYLKRTSGPARWADSRRAYHLQQVREHLLAADADPDHPRSWRPHVLLFSDDSKHRKRLFDFASWVQGQSGFTTAVQILEGQGAKILKEKKATEDDLRKDIQEHGIAAFPLVVAAPDLMMGAYSLIQAFGVGPLKANTILLNWVEQTPSEDLEERENRFGRNLRIAYSLGRNIVILCAKHTAWETLKTVPRENRRIDVWWWGDATSRLMLLFAYMMTRSKEWEDAKIRLPAVCMAPESDGTVQEIRDVLDDIQIDAEPEVVIQPSAADAATDSRKMALKNGKAAEKASDKADKKLRKVEEAASSKTDPEELKELKAEADAAEKQAHEAARKAAKAAAKAEDAAKKAEASGAPLPDTQKNSA